MKTNNTTMGETKMTHLGIMNGWETTPTKFQKHLDSCGTQETVDNIKEGKVVPYTFKVYPVATQQISQYYHEDTCQSCGCSWTRDSS